MGRVRAPWSYDVQSVREALLAERPAPREDSLDVVLPILDVMLGRAIGARERIDTRCAAIPALIGAVAGLAAGRLSVRMDGPAVVTGAAAALCAIIAVLAALWALTALKSTIGPNPVELARRTHLAPLDIKQAAANELAIGISRLSALARFKGNLLNVSLAFTALAGLLLVAFAAQGGIR